MVAFIHLGNNIVLVRNQTSELHGEENMQQDTDGLSHQVGGGSVKGFRKQYLGRNMQESISDSEKMAFRIHH